MEEHRNAAEKLIDPSSLTTAQLQREIASLKELLLTHIDRIDQAIEIAHKDLVRFPTEVQEAVRNLRELQNEKFISIGKEFAAMSILIKEKFEGVEKQFEEREIRIHNAKSSADNALVSAEKFVDKQSITLGQSISKSESSIMKQMELLSEKINDIKDRLTLIEGQSTGKKDFVGYIIGAIGAVAAIGSIIALLATLKT